MQTYKAPLRDMRFVLHELHADAQPLPGLEDFTPDVADAILEEAGKFCTERLLPLNASGDEEGCCLENGVVRTPKGFPEAYKAFREGGWTAMGADPAYGGQGLPAGINKLVEEMICSTNLSFGLYPGLSHGAYQAIEGHASEELKAAYLPKLVDGTWSGTMCLTEPHCGTDLGLLRTKAVPQDDGSFRVTGSKIFISAGDHDLTENIIHLVLAKIPDAPKGVKGISLFLVPKFLPRADGSPGERNGVTCSALEHKMGIKASATCQMSFDDATGWLVGEPHKGMRAMFTMMNSERLSVGIQGLGAGEAAYQGAIAYAKERLQGRALFRGGEYARLGLALPEHRGKRQRAFEHGINRLAPRRADEVVGVLPLRQARKHQAAPRLQERQGNVDGTIGGAAARLVAVEQEDRLWRHAPEQLELAFGQRRAERGHRLAETGHGHGDDVDIALDRDHPPRLVARLARAESVVEQRPLVKEVGFR